MMRKQATLIWTCGLLFGFAGLVHAGESGASFWSAEDNAKALAANQGVKKSSSATLTDAGHYRLSISRRGDSGEAEIHEAMTDIFIFSAGEATVVTGGEVVDAKTTKPGEIRGASLKGGKEQKMKAGDIIHIPAGTPHQTLLAPDQTCDYFVVKVAATKAK
jgi:mannose-6-phosphate isomerase-like protein (cupin superfamily)